MIIGTPKELKNNEFRVGLNTANVKDLVHHGHRVLIEKDAGLGSGISNSAYHDAGAEIVASAEEVYNNAEMIVKVKEPQPSEYKIIRPGQIIFTYFHFASSEALTRAMMKQKAICIAYETITDENNRLPLLTPMSEVAGRMSIQQAAKWLEKPLQGKGKLMGGVAGVSPSKVLILGGGVVGTEAAKMAAGLGADVYVFDINLDRIRDLNNLLPANVTSLFSSKETLIHHLTDADVVIGAVLIPGAKAPRLIDEKMLKCLSPGSVLVDVAIDQGGCFATSRPTTHEDPTYVVNDIIHYCVANIPGAVPMTATNALNNATSPFIRTIANLGWKRACLKNPPLKNGLTTVKGKLVSKTIADAFQLPFDSVQL